MAAIVTQKSTKANVGGSPVVVTIDAFTPTAGRVLVMAIGFRRAGAPTVASITDTFAGADLTWETFGPASANDRGCYIFVSSPVGASPGSGTITVTFNETSITLNGAVGEGSADIDSSDPVVGSAVTDTFNPDTGALCDLPAFDDADNIGYGALADNNVSVTPGTGMNELVEVGGSGLRLQHQYGDPNDDTIDWTFASTTGGAVAIQLRTVSPPITREITDALGLTDTASRTSAATRSVADTLGLTDQVSRTAAAIQSVADALGLTDSADRTAGTTREVSDTVGLTDAAARLQAAVREVSDTEGLLDELAHQAAYVRAVTDPVGLLDEVDYEKGIVRAITDTLGISDDAARVIAAVRSQADTLGLTDAASPNLALVRIVVDAVGLTDTVVVAAPGAAPTGPTLVSEKWTLLEFDKSTLLVSDKRTLLTTDKRAR